MQEWLSVFTMWVPGIELRLVRLGGKCFRNLSILIDKSKYMEGLGYSLIVKYVPTMHKALGWILSTIKTGTKNLKLHLFILIF